jgi:hypothetical protein
MCVISVTSLRKTREMVHSLWLEFQNVTLELTEGKLQYAQNFLISGNVFGCCIIPFTAAPISGE